MGVMTGHWKLWRADGIRALLRWRVHATDRPVVFGPCQIPGCPDQAVAMFGREGSDREVGTCLRHISLGPAALR